MKGFAREQVVDALIEGVVVTHEHVTFPSDSLARRGVLEVIADLGEAGIDVLVPGAMVAFAQHLGEAGRSVSEIESAGKDYHPGAIRCVGAAALGAVGIDAERDTGAGADGGELLSLDRSSAPVERLAPFFPAFAPDFEVVF